METVCKKLRIHHTLKDYTLKADKVRSKNEIKTVSWKFKIVRTTAQKVTLENGM